MIKSFTCSSGICSSLVETSCESQLGLNNIKIDPRLEDESIINPILLSHWFAKRISQALERTQFQRSTIMLHVEPSGSTHEGETVLRNLKK
ncbi:LOW QUALITY PROTEIN: hypothetical protein NC652_031547 [Populus alba x Populus x berolinensis]|nr:LOW QUALITY PROTEIN: hypothetical protein NC652_031547 [Populus alba x Populus x berolinensis]